MATRRPEKVNLTPQVAIRQPDVFVGLDLSTVSTGVAVITGDSVETFSIRPSVQQGHYLYRCMDIQTKLEQLFIKLTKGGKTLALAMEGYGIRGPENIPVIELGGLIRVTLLRLGLAYLEIPPSRVKLFVAGKGNATKLEVCHSLGDYQALIMKPPRKDVPRTGETLADFNNDEADALGVAACLRACFDKDLLPTTSYRAKVVENIKATAPFHIFRSTFSVPGRRIIPNARP